MFTSNKVRFGLVVVALFALTFLYCIYSGMIYTEKPREELQRLIEKGKLL